VPDRPNLSLPRAALDALIVTLEVQVPRLVECNVSPGWRLSFPAARLPAIHYTLEGMGRMIIGGGPSIALEPHTLVIAPSNEPFRIEVTAGDVIQAPLTEKQVSWDPAGDPDIIERFDAGETEPQVMLICGYFRAFYGTSIDLFAMLPTAIVEKFDQSDELEDKLRAAIAELRTQQIGAGAMATALLKQVFVALLRRSLRSPETWNERFAMLSEPRVGRAFADMVAQPGAPHSVQSLAKTAGLSRSAFMDHFTAAFGSSPIAVLRQIRMRRAAMMLTSGNLSLEQIAHAVGYGSRSSFSRAFRDVYGQEPQHYRVSLLYNADHRKG
jgi:AraC-like DNA-binding protein